MSEENLALEFEKFNLDAPAQNNYVNMVLTDMKLYKAIARRRFERGVWIADGINAINTLIDDLPPKGVEYMRQQYPELKTFGVNEIYFWLQHKQRNEDDQWGLLDLLYNSAKAWLWPNVFTFIINTGKPAYKHESHLGNQ